ncbi:uncharacterized protein LOC144903269 [Branchiostoma floridae x Branchiostoma belcheri]
MSVAESPYNVSTRSMDTQVLTISGREGSGEGELSDPVDVAVDKDGNIAVLENGNKRVQIFDGKTGQSLRCFPVEGEDHWGIGIDSDGQFIVTSQNLSGTGKQAISVYSREGELTKTLKPDFLGDPLGVAVLKDGRMVVADRTVGTVASEKAESLVTTEDGTQASTLTSEKKEPVVTMKDDTQAIREASQKGETAVNTEDGTQARTLTNEKRETSVTTEDGTQASMILASEKDLITCTEDVARASSEVTTSEDDTQASRVASQKGEPVVTTEEGAQANSQFSCLLLQPDGSLIREIGKGQFLNFPWFIAVDDSRDLLFVTDFYDHKVFVFDLEGNLKVSFGKEGENEGELLNPSGITFDPAGNIIVVNYDNNRLQVFKADGTYLRTVAIVRGKEPTGITLTPDGYIAVACFAGHCVELYRYK